VEDELPDVLHTKTGNINITAFCNDRIVCYHLEEIICYKDYDLAKKYCEVK